jgi:hypothetical protein
MIPGVRGTQFEYHWFREIERSGIPAATTDIANEIIVNGCQYLLLQIN